MPATLERVLRKYPWPSQQRFHGLHVRHKGFSGPVGSGKSLALVYEAIRLAVINPGLLGLIGAPTYAMLRDATQKAFFDEIEAAEIPYRFLKQENKLTLTDMGSEIIFRSMDNPERLRGTNLAWFGIDEMTYCDEDAFLRLQARLRDSSAKELCGFGVWTPKGYDWVYKRFIDHARKDLNYTAILATPGENKRVTETGMYEQLKGSYDERFYRQEVLGEYLNLGAGRCYYAFDREQHVTEDAMYDPIFPLCWSLDFNVDPMCSVIAQILDTTTHADALRGHRSIRVNVIDELYLRNASVQDAFQEFAIRAKRYWTGAHPLTVNVYGDATGRNRQSASAGTPSLWTSLRECFAGRREFEMVQFWRESNTLIRDRINAVNSMFRNARGEIRAYVNPRCEKLISDLEMVTWQEGSTAVPNPGKDGLLTHISDALGYLLQNAGDAGIGYRQGRIV